MPEGEENESSASASGPGKTAEVFYDVEDTGKGCTVEVESNCKLLPKKGNAKGQKSDSSNGHSQKNKYCDETGADGISADNAEVREGCEGIVMNGFEGETVQSRRSRTTKLRNARFNYHEKEDPGSDSEDRKVSSKKGKKTLRKKNREKMGGKSKKGKSTKVISKTEDMNAEEPDYEVEKIIDVKYTENGKRMFLLRWKGFSAKDDTWEPEENLDCQDLVKEYLEKKDSLSQAPVSEDESKLSGLRNKGKPNSGTRRSRRGGNRNTESEAGGLGSHNERNSEASDPKRGQRSQRSREITPRSSSRLTRENTTEVTFEDEENVLDNEEEAKQSRRGRGEPGGVKRKRENGSVSSDKSKRIKKSQDKENLDEGKELSGDSGMEDVAEYEVQKIVDVRHLRNGSREFYIKWKGFSAEHNTWEPEEHLNCSDKLKEFLQEQEKVNSVSMRELRFHRKKTDRLTIESPRTRKLSTRIQRQQRKSYIEVD